MNRMCKNHLALAARFFVWSACVFVWIGGPVAHSQSLVESSSATSSQLFIPRAEPLYEQCQSLDGGSISAKEMTRHIQALKSTDTKTRIQAIELLARSCDRRATAPLVVVVREDKDLLVRIAAIKALGHLGDRESIDPLLELVEDTNWQVRAELSRTLASFQVHRASYDVLNRLANPPAQPLADEGDMLARCQAILIVNQLREVSFSRKALYFLFSFLEDENPKFRQLAAAAMSELIKTRNGVHELIGTLKQHENPHLRIKAAYWLGQLQIESGRDILTEAAANDRDARVREVAAQALAKLKPIARFLSMEGRMSRKNLKLLCLKGDKERRIGMVLMEAMRITKGATDTAEFPVANSVVARVFI